MSETGSEQKINYREQHPELRTGERRLTNVGVENVGQEIGYQSKRVGKVAYDIQGNVIEGMVPVFVLKEEYNKKTTPAYMDK